MKEINSTDSFALAGIIIIPYAIINAIKELRESKIWHFHYEAALRVNNVKATLEKYSISQVKVIYTV